MGINISNNKGICKFRGTDKIVKIELTEGIDLFPLNPQAVPWTTLFLSKEGVMRGIQ